MTQCDCVTESRDSVT